MAGKRVNLRSRKIQYMTGPLPLVHVRCLAVSFPADLNENVLPDMRGDLTSSVDPFSKYDAYARPIKNMLNCPLAILRANICENWKIMLFREHITFALHQQNTFFHKNPRYSEQIVECTQFSFTLFFFF